MLARTTLFVICVLMAASHSAEASRPKSAKMIALYPAKTGGASAVTIEDNSRRDSIYEEAAELDNASLEALQNPALASLKEELGDVHAGMSKIVKLINAITAGEREPAPAEELEAWEGYIVEARAIMKKADEASS